MKRFLIVLSLLWATSASAQFTTTSNYGFKKPNSNLANSWDAYLNGDFDLLDTLLGGGATTAAATYNVGDLACVTATNTVGSCGSAAANLTFIGVLLAKNGTRPVWTALGVTLANSNASASFVAGDIVCSDPSNGGKVIDNGALPCGGSTTEVGVSIVSDGNVLSHAIVMSQGTTGGSTGALPTMNAGTLGGTLGNNGVSGAVWMNASGAYDLVANGGADPTGVTLADTAFANAIAHFTGNGGTITMCGTFKISQTIILTANVALKFQNNCGTSGSQIHTTNNNGGAVITSSTNSNVPNPTTVPTLTEVVTQGGTWTGLGPWYFKYSLVNGFGETLPTASSNITLGATTSAIQLNNIQYTSGGWAYKIYCSSDNVNFFPVTSAQQKGSAGTYGGPPYLTGGGFQPLLLVCPTSGTGPVGANTATKGMTLVQVGDMTHDVAAGPEFDNITFADGANVLGGGLVVYNAQRTTCLHCQFEGFGASGSALGGSAVFEQGGIGLAMMQARATTAPSTNFTEILFPEFHGDTLGFLQLASDSHIFGGDISLTTSNGEAFDYPGGNMTLYGTHISISGSTSIPEAALVRGLSSQPLAGGILSLKIEGLNRTTAFGGIKISFAQALVVDMFCSGGTTAATACIGLDPTSSGGASPTASNFRIGHVAAQPAFSDGTTIGKDPGGQNVFQVGGANPGLYVPSLQTDSVCLLGGAAGTASPAACSIAPAGKVAIPASQTTYTVNTTAVTANSQVIVQQTSDNSGLPSSPTCSSTVDTPLQTARTAGTSFTFTMTSVASVMCYQYWIVN